MLLPLLLALAQPPADFPHVVLSVTGARMTVYTPDPAKGFYRGTRFAHSGVIRGLEVGGFKLFGPWKDTHDPLNADDITGPAEEFGMFDPLGYAEAKPGERFVKIGVGELVKAKDEKYQFQGKYELANPGTSGGGVPGSSNIPHGETRRVILTHALTSRTGYGYRYEKELVLRPVTSGAELTINSSLTNPGAKPIATDVYNHNFLNVDGHPVGPKYRLTFPQPVKFTAESQFGPAAKFDGGVYTFGRELAGGESAFGWLTDEGGKPLPHRFTFRYAGAGKALTVAVSSDAPVSKFQTWSVRTCMCPEPFTPVSVKPGETQKWETKYAIRVE